jgi:hypothetical protein
MLHFCCLLLSCEACEICDILVAYVKVVTECNFFY